MRIKINGLDVWGSTEDGCEVNDVLGSHGTIEVSDDAADIEIINALIESGILYPGTYELDDFGDGFFGNITDPKDGRPIVQYKAECEHKVIRLTGKFETEVLDCPCGFKIPF
jgi:hypothetical protein